MKWYSERAHHSFDFSAGDSSAYGASIDWRLYAGAALYIPSGFTGTLQVQASTDNSSFAYCYDSMGNAISYTDPPADAWLILDADLFPLPYIRFVLTDGAGTPTPGATAYDFTLAVKS